jgi:hypothetical protein
MGNWFQTDDVDQRHNLIAIEIWIGLRDTEPNDDGALSDHYHGQVAFRDLIGFAGGSYDTKWLKGLLVQFGFQVLRRQHDRFSVKKYVPFMVVQSGAMTMWLKRCYISSSFASQFSRVVHVNLGEIFAKSLSSGRYHVS